MKNIKKLWLCLLPIIGIMAFSSCGEEDDTSTGDTIDQSLVYGSWRTTKVLVNGVEVPVNMTITINSNGTLLHNNDTTNYTWQNGNKIIVPIHQHSSNDEDVIVNVPMTIESVTSNNMVISFTGEIEGYNGTWKLYFEKTSQTSGENTSNYPQLIIGTWNATSHVVDGVTTQHEMSLTFNSDGTGVISDEGITEHNDFTYTISGSTINVTPTYGGDGSSLPYTIVSLTSTNAVIRGQSMPCYSNSSYIGYYTKSNTKKK